MSIDKTALKRGLRKGLSIAAETANVAVQLRSDSGPLGVLSVAVKLANSVLGQSVATPIEGWRSVDTTTLSPAIYDEARRANLLEQRPGTSPDNAFWIGTIHGFRFGWQVGNDWIDGPYVEPDRSTEDGAAALRSFLWQSSGTSLVYGKPEPGGWPTLESEEVETLPSAKAAEIWDRQRAFLQAGYRCAVLLKGEPGTGKTNVARHVADQAGGLRLRIRARDVEGMNTIARVVGYLQPSAVVIDDLCRAPNKDGVLDVFDSLTRIASLVIVTVNDVNALDAAVYRRFNALDVYTIDQLDGGVLDRLLVGVPEDAARRLRELPVKYIEDYRREAEVFGHARAMTAIEELVARRDEVRRMTAAQSAAREKAARGGDVVRLKAAKG